MPSRMLSRGIGLPLCPGGMYANMRVFGSMMRKTPERRGPGDGVTPVSGKWSSFLPFGNMTEAHADELAHLGAEVEIAAA